MIWNQDPIALRWGSVELPFYTLFFGAGLILAYLTGLYFSRKGAFDPVHVNALAYRLLLGILIGAHLIHLLFYEPSAIIDNPKRLLELGVGLASHGGALGAILTLYFYCYRRKLPFLRVADVCAVAALWLIPTIRLGNFFNSEIYGVNTDLPWGVTFVRAAEFAPRHPSQLYEVLFGCLLLSMVIPWYRSASRKYADGLFFWGVVLSYFSMRFVVEFSKSDRGFLGTSFPLTMGQVLSVPLIALSLWKALKLRSEGRVVSQ